MDADIQTALDTPDTWHLPPMPLGAWLMLIGILICFALVIRFGRE